MAIEYSSDGRLTSRPVSYGILNTFFVALSYGALRSLTVFTPFFYVCHVLLQLSWRVKFIDIKWRIMGTSSFILEQSLQ